jgi:vesicle coat complex subunit
MHSDVARQKMVAENSGKLIQVVVAALADPNADVRGAAALCLRGLCRSARLLRAGSIPAAVAAPLVTLLQDASTSDVQVRVN